jgi:subtilisin-like proprotein convertase family protein
VIRLEQGTRSVTLLDRAGGGDDDVRQTFAVADWNGVDAAGTWRLVVVDTANADVGTLNSWSMQITRCTGPCMGAEQTRSYASTAPVMIPDNVPSGVTSPIEVTDTGTITRMTVGAEISHTYPADLTLRLRSPRGREHELARNPLEDGPTFVHTYSVDAFSGEAVNGTWRLVVIDSVARDDGSLTRWTMDVTTR